MGRVTQYLKVFDDFFSIRFASLMSNLHLKQQIPCLCLPSFYFPFSIRRNF